MAGRVYFDTAALRARQANASNPHAQWWSITPTGERVRIAPGTPAA
jgi:hypothetical protein